MLLRQGSQRWRVYAAAAVAMVALALAASSNAAGGLSPFVDCMAVSNGSSGAWFGFSNTSSTAVDVAVGPNNFVSPGISFQGQPVHFGVGTYKHAFFVPFGQSGEVVWNVNGLQANATGNSPACVDAVSVPAGELTSTTATLNGVVTPNGDTSYVFQWGTTTSYGRQTQPATVTGTAPALIAAQLTGLQPGTVYHFRLETSNIDDGVTDGADQTFTTPAVPAIRVAPEVLTGPGFDTTRSHALVLGTVNPEGDPTRYHFDYGTSTAYGQSTRTRSAGTGTGGVFVTAMLGRLHSGKTYHYRLIASNAVGRTEGADQTFRTPRGKSHARRHAADEPTIAMS
jgi:hypothetical protein